MSSDTMDYIFLGVVHIYVAFFIVASVLWPDKEEDK